MIKRSIDGEHVLLDRALGFFKCHDFRACHGGQSKKRVRPSKNEVRAVLETAVA